MAVPIDPEELDELRPARRAARSGKLLAIPGGVLVFLAMFLPALDVCGDPVYPIQFPPVYAPYLLGLAGAIAVMKVDRDMIKVSGLFVLLMSVVSLGLYGLMVWSEVAETRNPVAPVLAIAWSVAVVALVSTWRRGRTWSQRGARALSIGAIGDVTFFAMLILDDNALVGCYVGLIGSIALLAGALCWEVDSASETEPPAMPPMRAL